MPASRPSATASTSVGARRLCLVAGAVIAGLYTGVLLASSPAPSSQDGIGLRRFLDAQPHANAQLLNQGHNENQAFMSLRDLSDPGGVRVESDPRAPPDDVETAPGPSEGMTAAAEAETPVEQQQPPPPAGQAREPEGKEGAEDEGRPDVHDEVTTARVAAGTEPLTVGAAVGPWSGGGASGAAAGGVKGLSDGVLECQGGRAYQGGIVYWKLWGDEAPDWEPLFPPPAADGQSARYVTFEPDEGGFNNVRASMEVMVVFALITGRTLVVPDPYPMYLLGEKGILHDFADFFDLSKVSRHVRVMQMKDFLAKEALTGQLRGGLLPPDNRTTFQRQRPLWRYIRSVSTAFPHSPDDHVLGFDVHLDQPRFQAMRGSRQLAEYGPALQAEKVVHFTSQFDGGIRWLTHFYAFFFFGDRRRDCFIRRFVRDYLHYRDNIFCAAAKIVQLIEQEAGGGGGYTAIHIRRGDFQFKTTRLPAKQIFENVADLIEPGSLVYVLTDERNASFFDDVSGRYRLRFLTDYWDKAGLDDANPNHSGMIEQVVASGAQRFVGTYFSTLSSYVTRLRGYQGKEPGYYFMPDKKTVLVEEEGAEHFARPPFFHREWDTAYKDIDTMR